MAKTDQSFKFKKQLKQLMGLASGEERSILKKALVDAEATIQNKAYKGKMIMNYDVKPDGKKPRKEVIRVEENRPLKIM